MISFTKLRRNAKSELYITTNGAANDKNPFKRVVLDFVTDGPVLFHPRKEDWLLIKGSTVDDTSRKPRVVKVLYQMELLSVIFKIMW